MSFTLMVHHIVLHELKPEVTPARVEAMMITEKATSSKRRKPEWLTGCDQIEISSPCRHSTV
jgi:hypothetical protein